MSKQVQVTVEKSAPSKVKGKPAPAPVISMDVASQMVAALTKEVAKSTAKKKGSNKPADKKADAPAAAPAATETKSVKPKTVETPLVSRQAKKGQTLFALVETARPVAGRALFAHTHAALTVTGMLQSSCPAIPQSVVYTLMGNRAISYHLKQGNFEQAKDHGIRLTTSGLNKFRGRAAEGHIDAKMANGYVGMFLDGTTEGIAVTPSNLFKTAY